MGRKKKVKKGELAVKKCQHQVQSVKDQSCIIAGIMMRDRVEKEKSKHFVGEHIKLNRQLENINGTSNLNYVDGYVVGIYPHILLIRQENHNTSVSYKDLALFGG